ncbi:OmpA family protein [Winogradskyella thalassocola]|uniref:Tetratricopeptide repeat-containing protein n=1 Tax=Winogradskyella thalassocola TaxID=262004 RepID=A0A1G8BIW0_9FLAO|nr:OmpA family protein [Winogradskyella thalassocola]SDH33162.1 Tetratricopeptide repeat-containing protein [Winogradskyella thalassocola]
MKKTYSLLCLLLIVTLGYGQSKATEKADKLYDGYQYVDAIDAYLKVVEDNSADTYVYKQLADSYYHLFNIKEASTWYKKALTTTQDSETYFRYAQVLKSEGNYDQANKQMDIFSKMEPNDQRAKAHLKNPNYIPKLADISKTFNVEEVGINDGAQSDFGAVLSNDNILYFVSTRKMSGKEDAWTNQPYLDIYKSTRNEDGNLSEPEGVEELNTIYHDGPLTISADGKTMYFSRDGHSDGTFKKIKSKRVKVAQQGIYKATMVEGKWGNIEALPINSIEYTVSHPSISSDGKTLYFASNMPNGMGDSDIWKISVSGNTYGEPVNLGPKVNTSGKEGFPYISEDGILYFASSGHQGFGGLDIFQFDLNKNEASVNLGNAINTTRDDFAFSVNNTLKVGYFSSNKSGVDNIYMAIPICQFETVALVKDQDTNAILPGASVTILDAQLNEIAAQATEMTGKTSFNVSCDNTYTINVSMDGYETASFKVEASEGEDVIVNADLKPINEMITETEVKLKNIYFEFNKSNITNQGALELDKLVEIMKDYPEMVIMIRSHTDTKGKADYNLKLSERRAQSTMHYVISKGVNKARLSAKGMGSTTPKIDCKSNCTEDEDAQNRRSEFLIVKD